MQYRTEEWLARSIELITFELSVARAAVAEAPMAEEEVITERVSSWRFGYLLVVNCVLKSDHLGRA